MIEDRQLDRQLKSKKRPRVDREGFDVTCVIGRVVFSDTGDRHPHRVAFDLIAQHDAPGTYTFPMEDGRECRVSVEYEGELP